jgi:hypothetical protein
MVFRSTGTSSAAQLHGIGWSLLRKHGFRSTGTSSAAQLHGIGWSLLRKHGFPVYGYK